MNAQKAGYEIRRWSFGSVAEGISSKRGPAAPIWSGFNHALD